MKEIKWRFVENILTDDIARNFIRWSDVKNKCLTRNQLFYSKTVLVSILVLKDISIIILDTFGNFSVNILYALKCLWNLHLGNNPDIVFHFRLQTVKDLSYVVQPCNYLTAKSSNVITKLAIEAEECAHNSAIMPPSNNT